jgi:hypothetical protein
MLDALQPFGAPDCESDLEILGESLYSQFYQELRTVQSTKVVLQPKQGVSAFAQFPAWAEASVIRTQKVS